MVNFPLFGDSRVTPISLCKPKYAEKSILNAKERGMFFRILAAQFPGRRGPVFRGVIIVAQSPLRILSGIRRVRNLFPPVTVDKDKVPCFVGFRCVWKWIPLWGLCAKLRILPTYRMFVWSIFGANSKMDIVDIYKPQSTSYGLTMAFSTVAERGRNN